MNVDALIAPLIGRLAGRCGDDELDLVERAYLWAEEKHAGQRRRSGDPYITHPVEVASLVAEAGADVPTICAALLHDTNEGSDFDADRLRADFGREIAGLVMDVIAIDERGAVPEDDRVLMIKLFDRLHNMRTIEHLEPTRQRVKSLDTLEWGVPLARRLDLAGVADELETIARERLDPGAGFTAIRAASLILPAGARRRYLREWAAEYATLPDGRRAYLVELLRGLPALAMILWRRPERTLLTAVLATRRRPWFVLVPVLAWLTFQLALSSFADALAFLLTVPTAISVLIAKIRARLGLDD